MSLRSRSPTQIPQLRREAKKMANRKVKAAAQTLEQTAQERQTAKSFTVFQDVELSFTENLIPTHIPVKQYYALD